MPKEVDIASGKRQLDGNAEAEYLEMLEKSLENIKKAFQVQQIWAIVSECSHLFHLPVPYQVPTGSMGPGQIRATSYRMDCCM
jgi:hypothetical protein